jgi:hypothetical protein
VNGYKVNIIRVVSAYNNADNSRIAAKYFGDITHPNGDITFMGDDGMTVTQIKKIVGGSSRTYNRGNRVDNELNQLEKLRKQLESLGLDTSEIDARIADNARREANREQIAALEAMKNELIELKSKIDSLGLSSTEIALRIINIEREIADLS